MTAQSGIGHRACGIWLAVSTMIVALRTGNAIVSVQAANTEVGMLQPFAALGNSARGSERRCTPTGAAI